MVRFAHECMNKMNRVVVNLAAKFGEDTLEMKLRVGLHSVGSINLFQPTCRLHIPYKSLFTHVYCAITGSGYGRSAPRRQGVRLT